MRNMGWIAFNLFGAATFIAASLSHGFEPFVMVLSSSCCASLATLEFTKFING